MAALTTSGIIAPWVLDGPINREAFETYVEKVLVPELPKDAVVIMDNLSSHKGPRIREMIEAAGATLLYLPPYSPDFNPIENAFAKLKANLRKAAERTVNGLWEAVGRIVDTYSPAESTNYFAAAGYLQPDRLTLLAPPRPAAQHLSGCRQDAEEAQRELRTLAGPTSSFRFRQRVLRNGRRDARKARASADRSRCSRSVPHSRLRRGASPRWPSCPACRLPRRLQARGRKPFIDVSGGLSLTGRS